LNKVQLGQVNASAAEQELESGLKKRLKKRMEVLYVS
jgi:hypothetical protein